MYNKTTNVYTSSYRTLCPWGGARLDDEGRKAVGELERQGGRVVADCVTRASAQVWGATFV